MKAVLCLPMLCVVLLSNVYGAAAGDKTITKVVKLLQGMMDDSKKEGDEEALLFAQHKCYCDKHTEEKQATIDAKTKEIALLESSIEKLQADNGKLSAESAKLVADMAANEIQQSDATTQRGKENTAYLALKADLEDALGQMTSALDILSGINGDQTLGAAADHSKFMAGYSAALISKVKAKVKVALAAADSFIPHEKRRRVLEFMQAPFTGSYTTQSVEVVGILKNMFDTYTANLKEATDTENKAKAAYDKLMEVLKADHAAMKSLNEEKQSTLSENDDSLSSKKASLSTAISDKADAEDFLEKLTTMCAEKAKEYNDRKMMRVDEQAAIAQAIAILDSDASFETFGKVDATSTGATSFLQLRRGSQGITSTLVSRLKLALHPGKSMKVARVLYLVQTGNPFETVLDEIDKMLALIATEGGQDKENLDFCNAERTEKDGIISEKKKQIVSLTSKKNSLTDDIENKVTGLKAQLAENAKSLNSNRESKETETKDRTKANQLYQEDIATLVSAEKLLSDAISVLEKYYTMLAEKLAREAFIQNGKADPSPPSTWDKGYKGQSTKGNNAISMLEFILKETKAEETEAHKDEQNAQHAYEDSMQDLVDEEKRLLDSKVTLEKNLADKTKELIQTTEDLEKTEDDKKKLEEYLASIKPGCDFITTNFQAREQNRAEEKKALEGAVTTIKGSPAYKAAVAAAHQASLGKCKAICNSDGEEKATCKACLADVSVPGYCAGHPGTAGCSS